MYLTGEKQEAINLGLRELIVNVQDEYEVFQPKNPYCKIILDTKTRVIICEDNARGIPVGERNDGMNSLTAAFLIPHSGGKHQEGAYSSAIGINGEGNKIVCHTAKWLEVEVKRDGKIYKQRFESDDEGAKPVTNVEIIGTSNETGTKITYKADEKVYGDIYIDISKLEEMLKNMSLFSKGLKFILIVDEQEKIFYSENGLIDGLETNNALTKPFSYYYETDDCKVELALQWVTKNGEIRGYANSLYVKDGGRFISQFKSSLTRTFNSLAKDKFDGEQIRKLLDGFVSVKVRVGQWSNQQKTSLANPEAGTATSAAISNCLKDFAQTRPNDFNKVIELLTRIQKAEKAADKAREAVLSQNKEIDKELKKKVILAEKLADCRYHDERSQLMICEGKSAKGALVKARNSDTTACFDLRGKLINTLKNDEEKIAKNEEIKQLHVALGCGVGDKFNMKKLRYGKIVIMADMDKDGFDIACLVLTFFYTMYPQLLQAGKIYWGVTPLFKVESKGHTYFAYDEKELQQLPKGDITRMKGLGESQPSDFRQTIFSEKAKMVQMTMENGEEAAKYFDILLGTNIEERRKYIFANANFENLED